MQGVWMRGLQKAPWEAVKGPRVQWHERRLERRNRLSVGPGKASGLYSKSLECHANI